MKIRVAAAPDHASLLRLALAFRDHLKRTEPADEAVAAALTPLIEDPAIEFCLAMESDGVAIGYTYTRFFRSLWGAPWEAHLEDLFVDGAARRRGTGRALVEFVTTRARLRGCASISLNTNEANPGAQALYRGLGFEPAVEESMGGGRELYWYRSLLEEAG